MNINKPKLSQSALYEVLVTEIESLKKSRKEYKAIYERTSAQLKSMEALCQQSIPVNTTAMEREHENIRRTLQRALYIPRWLAISWVCLLVGFGLSGFINYRQYVAGRQQRAFLEQAASYIEQLEKEVKTKTKKRR